MADQEIDEDRFSLVRVEKAVWVVTRPIGMARYDFAFEEHFSCHHPIRWTGPITAIARMGAAEDYDARFRYFSDIGITLIHSPADYRLTSTLPEWYPRLADLTPRSQWYDAPPSAAEVSKEFQFPVFVKGERQTSRHQRRTTILESPEAFDAAMNLWRRDPILAWQRVVCREFLRLRAVGPQSAHNLPRVFEFRSFWWKGQCVGIGPYWQDEPYSLTPQERDGALTLGAEVAKRIGVTLLCIDLAQTEDGRWIVIEINDGQDAGYAGVKPREMWQKILELEDR